ncbi:MAG: ABC transporter permease subunit [Luteolibacter sp.]
MIGYSGFLIIIAILVMFLMVNDGAVQKTFFSWEHISKSFWPVAKAMLVNIQIAIFTLLLSLTFGLLLALTRNLKKRAWAPLRSMAIGYIDMFRGLPALVVIYLVCFGIPLTKIPVISEQSPILYAVIALTLSYSAYIAEMYRSGFDAVDTGQMQAALSLGMSYGSAVRVVTLPQVFRIVTPNLLSAFISMQKDSALVYVVGIIDSFGQAQIYAGNYYNLSAVIGVCICFIAITIPQARFVDHILARQDRRQSVGES